MNHRSLFRPTLLLSLALALAACGGAETPEDISTPTPTVLPDAGVRAPRPDAGATADGGFMPDAGDQTPDAGNGECPEGYTGDRCDRCARGYQDGNADGICSLACDATGDLAPDCGQGRCFIDPEIDGRACACDVGHVGEHCDQCDVGYADPDGDGICVRTCELDCGDFGTCVIADDDSESCECNEGYEGAICEMCSTGFVPDRSGACVLDLPDTTDLTLWLDATEASSIELSRGGGVSAWQDRRRLRGAIEMTSTLRTRQPTYAEPAFSGRPAVRFDGVDDRLSVNAFTGFAGDDYTLFVLVQPHARTPAGVVSASHSELGTALGLDLYNPDATFVHQLPGMPNMRDSASTANLSPTEPMVIGVRRWTSGLLDHIRLYGRLAGDPMGIEVDDNLLSVGNLGNLNLALGVGPSGDHLAGDLGEVLVYDRALDDTEMRAVLDYLAAKWRVP